MKHLYYIFKVGLNFDSQTKEYKTLIAVLGKSGNWRAYLCNTTDATWLTLFLSAHGVENKHLEAVTMSYKLAPISKENMLSLGFDSLMILNLEIYNQNEKKRWYNFLSISKINNFHSISFPFLKAICLYIFKIGLNCLVEFEDYISHCLIISAKYLTPTI